MTRDELAAELFAVWRDTVPRNSDWRTWQKIADLAIELLGQPVKPGRRRIVHLGQNGEDLVALCDDGTVWVKLGTNSQPEWFQVPGIPQPSQEPA